MKKKMLTMVLMCIIAMGAKAQVYGYDSWAQMPTIDLYDDGMLNMLIRAAAENGARLKAEYEASYNQTETAFRQKRWYEVINNANRALAIRDYNGYLYYMRGYAYEQIGDWKEAKRDYKRGKRCGSGLAEQALSALKAKEKQRKKNYGGGTATTYYDQYGNNLGSSYRR